MLVENLHCLATWFIIVTMFKFDDKEIRELEADLKTFARRALPFATKSTLNGAAFDARRIGQQNIKTKMVTRNTHAVRSVQVEQTRTLSIRNQVSTVGSTADYMEVQEFGGVKAKPAITTGYAAGQEGQKPRTRLARKPNKMANIKLSKRKSRKGRNVAAIKQAAAAGQKYIFLDLGRRKGIFRLLGGKRRPKIKMVQDLTRTSVDIPATPWLGPAHEQAIAGIPQRYAEALRFQLKRHRILS